MAEDQEKKLAPIITWRSHVASEDGPDSPTTRHVLLTLALHMNEKGRSCFPSTRLLARETGLTKRTVLTHLERAERQGWIERRVRGFTGQGWKRFEYTPRVPDVVKEVHHEGGEAGSPPVAENEKGGESDAGKVVKEVHHSSSKSSSSTQQRARTNGASPPDPSEKPLPTADEASEVGYPDAFERCWAAYPERSGGNPKKGAYRSWRARVTSGADPPDLLAATRRYAAWCEAEGQVGTRYVKQAKTFYGPDEHWKEDYEVGDTDNGPQFVRQLT